MKEGTTSSGFVFCVDPAALDNMELLDALDECSSNNLAVSRVLKLMLGAGQKKKLYDHLRTEDGRVPVEACLNTISEIFELIGEKKS